MFLNTLCDAYEEPLYHEEERPLLRFHRKLAPYKISFAITSSRKCSFVVLFNEDYTKSVLFLNS